MSGNRRDTATMRPVGEEPPYLTVGTEVSAKYRGAFCEASIKSVKKMVKCKVTYNKGNGNSTVTDDCIIGELKVGSEVEVKQPDAQVGISGTLSKITDSSVYTVVFDDGDERTLKRSSLCLKGEKHFNESETLDHLPLTDPENFGTPVVQQQGKKSRKGRRQSTSNDGDESKNEVEIAARKKLLDNEENTQKVVMVDVTEKKKTISLPALTVSSVGSKYGDLKSPENVLVRSFKDGKYLEVHLKDVKEFSKEVASNPSFLKGESAPMKSAVSHALKYLDNKQLPSNWSEKDSKSDENDNKHSDSSSSSDEEVDYDEKEREEFMTKLTTFLDENGTPLVRSPVLGHRDLDLFKLYRIVSQMDGMEKIKSWHKVYLKMDIPIVTTTASYHIKNAYRRYLFDFEQHEREMEEKKTEGKKGGKNEKSTKNVALNKQKNNTHTKGGFDKELKELNFSEENKDEKRAKGSRVRNKSEKQQTKTLKSPNSPKLSPRSPCSPKSVSSISAPGSTGCPSPLESSCESRELRSKAGDATSSDTRKENECISNEKDILPDVKNVLNTSDDHKEETVKDTLSDVKNQTKACRNNGRYLKVAVGHLDIKREEKIKKDNGLKTDSVKKEDVKKEDIKKVMKEDKKEDIWKEEDQKDVEENVVKKMDEKMDQDGECEDAVDVVNSPSGTSNESIDDDNGSEGRSESSGKIEKLQETGNDGGVLKYKLNDRIDVRYGRGRNATVYQAKITSVDPSAEESLYYLVHYQGWNARHDEWIGHERIIGKGQKQTRTRTNSKPPSRPNPKPCAKPVAKKNGKNGSVEKPPAKTVVSGKGRKRTPSPPPTNKNGRNNKNKNDKCSVDSLDLADVKLYPRVTRQNSASTPVRNPALVFGETKCEPAPSERNSDIKLEDENKSPRRSSPTVARSLSTSDDENRSSSSPGKKTEGVAADESLPPAEVIKEEIAEEKPVENSLKSELTSGEVVGKVEQSISLKRPHESYDHESSPTKKKHEDDTVFDVVFDEERPPDTVHMESKDLESPEPEVMLDEGNTPDLTCTEQMSTNCGSPDAYATEFSEHGGFFGNGIGREENGNGLKGKDSSSSVEETKLEKSSSNRRTKSRRKARIPSSQSSFDGGEYQNGLSDRTTFVMSPTWAPKYNFTEGLEELLKKEESSERIRLLQEKIKDIRKVYGELKSEVANIDRKRKRRQKRKREEELSAEESNARSPSRSSPLATSNASTVGSSTSLAAVECR